MNEQTAQTTASAVVSGDLSPAQHRALAIILRGGTQEQAGQAAGVTARTVRNWLNEEAFAAILTLERRALWEQTLCQVQQAAAQATQTLVNALSDGKATVRMRAAKLILDLQLKLERLRATAVSKANQKPRGQKLRPIRNEAEAIVSQPTSAAATLAPLVPSTRSLRIAMPQ